MATGSSDGGRVRARVGEPGTGATMVATGLPILDHLLGLLARYAEIGLSLEVAPGATLDEIASAGGALGSELGARIEACSGRGYGSAAVPADEALAHVALEASGRARFLSNVDLSLAHVGGLGTDLVARFLAELAEGGRLTLHVRLIEGEDTQHVLDAIFKSLGAALAQAATRKEA